MSRTNRCNSRLDVQPLLVARLFAASNLHDAELDQAQAIIDDLTSSRYGPAKAKCDAFVRPEFGTALDYYRRKQFTALVSKVPFTGDSASRKRVALRDFHHAELLCKLTNKRLRYYHLHSDRMPELVRVALTRAREWVRRVLGQLTEERLSLILDSSRPGSGVSIGTRNRFRVSLPFKLGDTDLSTTSKALPYSKLLVEGSLPWLQLHVEVDWKELTYDVPYVITNSNRIAFVPKDARTLRTIAIEPSLNVCLQLGVHSYMSDRLKKFGNAIDDQSRNQDLACRGSVLTFGHSFATLDLSQASDSVSTELVRWLLPSDWFSLLDDIRCDSGIVEGSPILYEKFSSMGNGFTFALETLIFWALSKAVSSLVADSYDSPSCYGDDIIVGDREAALLLETLRFCGFRVNPEKSFVVGPFRESCGADWHSGIRVTPHYVRKCTFRCTDVYSLLNRSDPVLNWTGVRSYLLTEHCKKEPILFGLECEDTSSCLFTTPSYMKGGGGLRWSVDWQNWTFKAWAFVPELEKVPILSAYAAALKGALASDARYQLRGRGVFRLRFVTPGITRGLARFTA
jgi:hypothetical protein